MIFKHYDKVKNIQLSLNKKKDFYILASTLHKQHREKPNSLAIRHFGHLNIYNIFIFKPDKLHSSNEPIGEPPIQTRFVSVSAKITRMFMFPVHVYFC